jgi:hypothetical protein
MRAVAPVDRQLRLQAQLAQLPVAVLARFLRQVAEAAQLIVVPTVVAFSGGLVAAQPHIRRPRIMVLVELPMQLPLHLVDLIHVAIFLIPVPAPARRLPPVQQTAA